MQLADVTDEELLRATLAGGAMREEAFLELVGRYERRIYGICHRFFGNHADAQDATQDTFIAIARRGHNFRGDSKLSTWVFRIAVNACKDRARARDRRPQTPVADVAEAAAAGRVELHADDQYGLVEVRDEIAAALDQLDEVSRTLIILCAIEGRDYAEVARIMDMPVGTIKSRVFRARAKLAELLAPVLDPDVGEREPPSRRPPDRTVAPRTVEGGSSGRGPPA